MMDKEVFATFAWRGDGQYHIRDAIGARYWLRRASAEKEATKHNTDLALLAVYPRGIVVRPSGYFRIDGCVLKTVAFTSSKPATKPERGEHHDIIE